MILCAKTDVIPELKVPAIGDVTTIPHESSIKLGTFGEITFYLSQRSAKATASDRLSLFHMISQQHEKHDKTTESVENMMPETESIDLSVFADGSVRPIPAQPKDDKAGDDDPGEAPPEKGEPPVKSKQHDTFMVESNQLFHEEIIRKCRNNKRFTEHRRFQKDKPNQIDTPT